MIAKFDTNYFLSWGSLITVRSEIHIYSIWDSFYEVFKK